MPSITEQRLTGRSYLFLEKQFANQMKEEAFIQTPPPDVAAKLDEIVGAKERSDEQKVADIRALMNATLSADDRKYLSAFHEARRLLRQLSDNDEAKLHFVINDKSFSDTERHEHVKELLRSAGVRVDVGPAAAPAKRVNALLTLIPLVLVGGLVYAMFGLRSRTGRIVARVAAGAVVLMLALSGGIYVRCIFGFTPDIDASGAPRHFSKSLPDGMELEDFSILGEAPRIKNDFLNYQGSNGPYTLMLRIPLDQGQVIRVSSVTITYADGQQALFSGTELKTENVPYDYLCIPGIVTRHQDLVAAVEGTIAPVKGESKPFSVSYGFRAESSFVALPALLTGIGG